jgi:methylglutaconyl-CoA hydratase
MDMHQHLRVETRGRVMWLTIDRAPRRNAIDRAMIEALRLALIDAGADPAIHAVVLTGAGERAFCSGADMGGGSTFARRCQLAFRDRRRPLWSGR